MELNQLALKMPASPILRRPILRWAGSKRKLLPRLTAVMPSSYNQYIEPFFGSGCLFFTIKDAPKSAIVGDLNKELINTYRVLRKTPDALFELVKDMPKSEKFYYELRRSSPVELNDSEKAARFVYLNRFCFNGVYRLNRLGQFNVPRGTRTGQIPSRSDFRACAERLRNTVLLAGDFEKPLARAKKNDFVYLDPPYAKRGTRRYGEYGYNSFSERDIQRLVRAVLLASERGAKVLLSYSCTPELLRPFRSWTISRVFVRRHVAGFSDKRRVVGELLISNYSN